MRKCAAVLVMMLLPAIAVYSQSLADLANATPSLSFTNSANGTPVYTLRGVGFYETSIGAYPTVSTYVDEAPLAFPRRGES